MKTFLRQTLLGGLFVVLPVTVILLLLARAVASIRAAMEPFAAALPFEALFPGIWAVLALVLLSFLAGLILQLRLVRGFTAKVGHWLAERFPFLAFVRRFEESLLGKTADLPIKPALVEIEEALVPAFVVEELADGRCVVFVPAVPNPMQGAVYILTRERVHLIDASVRQVARCVSHWGVGLEELVNPVASPQGSVK
jgi:uncharacterized membrane protein